MSVKKSYQKVYYLERKALGKQVAGITKENDTYQKFNFLKDIKLMNLVIKQSYQI